MSDSTATNNWKLVWADEFDGAAGAPVDDSKWTHEIGGWGWGNNELETYTDSLENSSLDGSGNLAIVARADTTGERACHYGVCRYTSARLLTRGKFEFTHGRVESRLKLPYGQGIWPAFWMLGADIEQVGWPQSGEIDIMEYVGKEPRMTYGTLHGPGYSGANAISKPYTIDKDFADDFHTYAVEWQPNVIRWYVDGDLFHTLTPETVPGEWVYEHDFFILLNLAVGGY
ncbi:MAG: glycoside hydrolase family 16 protein, partial [Chloroflexota bacterium]